MKLLLTKNGLQEQYTGFTGGRKQKAMTMKWAENPQAFSVIAIIQ
jgi:hypothetical protein